MALSVVNAGNHSRATIDWAAIQVAQFEHDETYHREISRLSMQDRLRHMALHFAKYAGRLLEDCGDQAFKQTAIDALVIAISCANILNIDLSKRFCEAIEPLATDETYVRRLAISTGRMAAACEKLDHLEDFPFRRVMEEAVLAIVSLSVALFREKGWDPVGEMRARLAPLKAKSIFHGKL